MNSTILNNRIEPADRLVIPKSALNIVQHHAIYLGQNYQGVDLIAENKIGFGVRLITADDFFREVKSITRIEKFNGNPNQRKDAVERALRELGKSYNLINYNCESFSNHVQRNVSESNQVKVGFAFAGLLALLIGISYQTN